MWERVKNARTISVIVNNDEYEEFKGLLPKGTTVGEYVRKVMKEEVELQKKELALTSSSIGVCYGNNKPSETIKGNSTLDIWLLEKRDIIKHIDNISDIKTLAQIEEKGKVFYTIAQTKKRRILKGEIKA